MRKSLAVLFAGLCLSLAPPSSPTAHADDTNSPQSAKEWTFLVYLNGHNNLDRYGAVNINQMEQVGSTRDLNIVVQWASSRSSSTKRIYVQKDNDAQNVTSPVVQDVGTVDMGDWRNLVDFVRWAHATYPAKHYFINVWDHGTGWHELQLRNRTTSRPEDGALSPFDISFDDDSGNSITTEQLGQAMGEAAQIIGHKVDIYGSDACLMAMAEIAAEMAGSVEIFLGSEETEPPPGWPYDAFIQRWAANPDASGAEIAKILTSEYLKSYSGGSNGNRDVTFSAFDLNKMGKFNDAITALRTKLMTLESGARKKMVEAIQSTQSYSYPDYGDLGDFLKMAEKRGLAGAQEVSGMRDAINEFVIVNQTSPRYSKSKGVAIWLPGSRSTYDSYLSKYKGLQFDRATGWADALQHLLQDATSLY